MLVRQGFLAGLAGVFLFSPFARSDEFDLFENEVRPVLVQHCYRCHGAKQQRGGSGSMGPSIWPTRATEPARSWFPATWPSRLIQAVEYTDDPKMPPAGKLPDHAINALKQWVKKVGFGQRRQRAGEHSRTTGLSELSVNRRCPQ